MIELEDWEKKQMEAIAEEQRKEEEQNEKVLAEVKALVSEKIFKLIEEEMAEAGHCAEFAIVDKPEGEEQGYDNIKIYVDQTVNGGYSGDTFEGYKYAELPNGKYLKWWYSC